MSIKSQSNTGIFLEGFKNDLRHLNRIQILSGHFCVFTFYICAVPDCLPSASPWHFPLRPRLWSSGVSQCNHGAQSNRKLTAWGSLSSPSGTEALSNLPLTKDWICARDLTTGPVLTVSSWTRFSHADSKLLVRLHSAIHDMQGEDSAEEVKKRRRRACMSDSHLCPKILQIHLPAVVGGGRNVWFMSFLMDLALRRSEWSSVKVLLNIWERESTIQRRKPAGKSKRQKIRHRTNIYTMGSKKDGFCAAWHGSCETKNQNKHFFDMRKRVYLKRA